MGAVGRFSQSRRFQVLVSFWGRLADPHTHSGSQERSVWRRLAQLQHRRRGNSIGQSWIQLSLLCVLPSPQSRPSHSLFHALVFPLPGGWGSMSQALSDSDCADNVDEKRAEPTQKKEVFSREIHRPWAINECHAPQKRGEKNTRYISWILHHSLSHSVPLFLLILVLIKFSLLSCISSCVVLLEWCE